MMEIQQALKQLDELQKKLYSYTAAQSSLYLDGVTVAPRDTSAGRGVALGILAGEQHKTLSDPKVGEMLEVLSANTDQLTPEQRRQVELLTREYRQLTRIPAQEYMEYAMLVNEASDVWHRAKETNDFPLFAPLLEKLVDYNRRFAGYYDPDKAPYDALLNEYERGITMEQLDQFFATVRDKLVPLIHAIGEKEQPDVSFLHRHYPVDVASSMYSVIHEGGHARYELDVNPDYDYTCLSGGSSMGIHESQSRFYENLIGRSLPFVEAIFPKMQELFPDQLSDVTAQQMYRAVNMAQPSLIRTEADELTYCLHVMVRYEMEKKLIGGTLEVKDVPAEWNRLYKEYLGVDVPDDTRGCLQDSHWSGGAFGYFPSYALGSAYGAQMLRNMEKEVDVWGSVARGDLSPVTGWLTEKIHRYGCMLDPKELVQQACGDFDPTVYTDYLTEKYSKLYNL